MGEVLLIFSPEYPLGGERGNFLTRVSFQGETGDISFFSFLFYGTRMRTCFVLDHCWLRLFSPISEGRPGFALRRFINFKFSQQSIPWGGTGEFSHQSILLEGNGEISLDSLTRVSFGGEWWKE